MAIDTSKLLGTAHPKAIAEYLETIGDTEAAARFYAIGGRSQGFDFAFLNDEWGYTGAKIGFIPEAEASKKSVIENAIGMAPDAALVGTKLKITLDHFYCQNYPGLGQHTILCDFTGNNQAGKETEAMRFAVTVKANDHAAAAHVGLPIFVGVNVGKDGLSFEGRTVNVRSEDDDAVLAAMNNATFRDGLALLTTAQPVLKPFVKLAEGVVGAVVGRSKNKEVFAFALGLDFSNSATSAKLRRGSYVVVQTDEAAWDWGKFLWDPAAGAVMPKNGGKPIGLNHMVFGVSEFTG